MRCLFCRIASSEEPAQLVVENEHVLAFLDHRPLFPGHVLVVPRRHVETLGELPLALMDEVMRLVRVLSVVVPEAVEAEGSFVAMNNIVSQSVPHLHVHVVPRRKGDGLKGFFWPRTKYRSEDEMGAVAARICEAITRLHGR